MSLVTLWLKHRYISLETLTKSYKIQQPLSKMLFLNYVGNT